MSDRSTVFIMSPYAGNTARNIAYARAAMADSIARGEAPMAPHLMYPQDGVLSDDDPHQRDTGIACGLAWARWADIGAVYIDLGISAGMRHEIRKIEAMGLTIEHRRIDGWGA